MDVKIVWGVALTGRTDLAHLIGFLKRSSQIQQSFGPGQPDSAGEKYLVKGVLSDIPVSTDWNIRHQMIL